MSADPYVTVDDFAQCLTLFGQADTCAKEAYGDRWQRMDAIVAEQLPWPEPPLEWDTTPANAKAIASLVYGGRYGWGVLMMSSRGPRALRIAEQRRTDRLIAALYGVQP